MYLQLENVEKYYGENENRVQVLKGVNGSIERGEICVMLGPSGSGKSTHRMFFFVLHSASKSIGSSPSTFPAACFILFYFKKKPLWNQFDLWYNCFQNGMNEME